MEYPLKIIIVLIFINLIILYKYLMSEINILIKEDVENLCVSCIYETQ